MYIRVCKLEAAAAGLQQVKRSDRAIQLMQICVVRMRAYGRWVYGLQLISVLTFPHYTSRRAADTDDMLPDGNCRKASVPSSAD